MMVDGKLPAMEEQTSKTTTVGGRHDKLCINLPRVRRNVRSVVFCNLGILVCRGIARRECPIGERTHWSWVAPATARESRPESPRNRKPTSSMSRLVRDFERAQSRLSPDVGSAGNATPRRGLETSGAGVGFRARPLSRSARALSPG